MRAEERALCVRGFAISAARPVLARIDGRRGRFTKLKIIQPVVSTGLAVLAEFSL